MPDVVIVGAGSAGGVLAARLSEDPACSVLLLEAGPGYGPTPEGQPADVADAHDYTPTGHDWGYVGESTAIGRRLPTFAGKVVGGSSATNNVMALRGHPADYDGWAAAGNEGWGFADVLPSFARVERDLDFSTPWHGADGPLPLNAVDGVRQSVALTYLAAARRRPNLSIRPHARVDRVLVAGGRAVGVRLASPEETIHADRVVVAAGSYASPAILLRSGVGPEGDLRRTSRCSRAAPPPPGARPPSR